MDVHHQARRGGLSTSESGWAAQLAVPRASAEDLARARRGHLGGARRAPAFHPFQGDGLGRVRPRDQERRRRSGWKGRSTDWRKVRRRDFRGGLRERLRPGAGQLRAVLRLEATRRQPAADPRRRLLAGDRSAGARHGRGDRAPLAARRLRHALRHRSGRRRPAAGRRRVPRLQLLARRRLYAAGPRRRCRAAVPPASRCATTSAC